MKSTLVSAFVVAAVCSTVFVSRALAGPRQGGNQTAGNASGVVIGGYVPPRTPLPPLIAPNLSTSPLTVSGNANKVVTHGRSTPSQPIVFSPPPGGPLKVIQAKDTSASGNISGRNSVENPFHGSILDAGLSKSSSSKSAALP
jgi:hypothetical protein